MSRLGPRRWAHDPHQNIMMHNPLLSPDALTTGSLFAPARAHRHLMGHIIEAWGLKSVDSADKDDYIIIIPCGCMTTIDYSPPI